MSHLQEYSFSGIKRKFHAPRGLGDHLSHGSKTFLPIIQFSGFTPVGSDLLNGCMIDLAAVGRLIR